MQDSTFNASFPGEVEPDPPVVGHVLFRPFAENETFFFIVKHDENPRVLTTINSYIEVDEPLSTYQRLTDMLVTLAGEDFGEVSFVFARIAEGKLTYGYAIITLVISQFVIHV